MKKKLPFCLRCGIDKKKGFWELGCSSWGTYYKRHIWNTSKKFKHDLHLDEASKASTKDKFVFNCNNCPTGYEAHTIEEAYEMAVVRPCPKNMRSEAK